LLKSSAKAISPAVFALFLLTANIYLYPSLSFPENAHTIPSYFPVHSLIRFRSPVSSSLLSHITSGPWSVKPLPLIPSMTFSETALVSSDLRILFSSFSRICLSAKSLTNYAVLSRFADSISMISAFES
jgi:hypothetical protein